MVSRLTQARNSIPNSSTYPGVHEDEVHLHESEGGLQARVDRHQNLPALRVLRDLEEGAQLQPVVHHGTEAERWQRTNAETQKRQREYNRDTEPSERYTTVMGYRLQSSQEDNGRHKKLCQPKNDRAKPSWVGRYVKPLSQWTPVGSELEANIFRFQA